jgi:uncharacterized Rmd1/YagE family protein
VAIQILPGIAGKEFIRARVLFMGERIDLRAFGVVDRIAVAPLTLPAGEIGCAVLFRYGAVVLFDLTPPEEQEFLARLAPWVSEPFTRPERDETTLAVDPVRGERVEGGIVVLREYSLERLQIVADILAKSTVLSHHESGIAEVFERIEPLAAHLRREGRGGRRAKELLRHIGGTLLIEHKMVWRVEVGEKPEILWERPELERLYLRLADEYELTERHAALGRKLNLIYRTAQTLLGLLQHQRSLRVEWYIVVLIMVEVLLMLYGIFFRH